MYSIFLIALVILPYVTCYRCSRSDGLEGNLKDEGCESYWECRHFVGVALKKCPDGGQFDFNENKCKPNGDVWCQWQHKQIEDAAQSSEKIKLIVPNQDPRNQGMTSNYYYVDSNYNTYGQGGGGGGGRGGFVDYDYYSNNNNNNNNNDYYHDMDKWTYVCRTEWGHEPNLADRHCTSFWRCDHFKGSLVQCKPGLVYDHQVKACRHPHGVDCPGQRDHHHHHVTSQPKHRLEVKKNPDGTTTLIHHHYSDKK